MKALALLLLMVGACAQVPESTPVGRILTIAHLEFGASDGAVRAGCEPRSDADYVAMRVYVDALDADVIAF